MPANCTALDFAFQIHTFLGSHCIGAKVNHKLVPLSHKLSSGDQVEILTSNSQHVLPSWVNFVSTAKAKGKILAILRRDRREIQKKGETILQEFMERNHLELTTQALDRLCEFHDVQKHEDLYYGLGRKNIILGDKDIDEILGKNKKTTAKIGWRRYVPFMKEKSGSEEKKPVARNYMIVGKDFNRKKPVIITESNINQFLFPGCCHPIPGDDALGFIDGRHRIEIHKRNCPVASKLKSSYGNRILDAKWDMHKTMFFDATIEISGIDRMGLLKEVTQVICDRMNVNIRKVVISSNQGIFDGSIELRVHDREDVRLIMDELKIIDGLQEINQII
jgi:GTP pyrophosphokinase